MIIKRVGTKKLTRRGANLERLFISASDGAQQWREYLPLFLSDDKKTSALLMNAAKQIAAAREEFENHLVKLLLSDGAKAMAEYVDKKLKEGKLP